MTITEGLAEIKVLNSRIEKKRRFIQDNVMRGGHLRDPHEANGGSRQVITQEIQSIGDMEERIVRIRTAIMQANMANTITVGKTTRTIAEWLTWRRDVAPGKMSSLTLLERRIESERSKSTRTSSITETKQSEDIVVNIDELWLHGESEEILAIMEKIDGQLSLKNATVIIDA